MKKQEKKQEKKKSFRDVHDEFLTLLEAGLRTASRVTKRNLTGRVMACALHSNANMEKKKWKICLSG